MILCGDITLDAEFLGMAAGLCQIERKLHPKKVVHVRAECFLNAEGHFRGRAALPAGRSDRVARRTLRMSAALDMLKPSASMFSVLTLGFSDNLVPTATNFLLLLGCFLSPYATRSCQDAHTPAPHFNQRSTISSIAS